MWQLEAWLVAGLAARIAAQVVAWPVEGFVARRVAAASALAPRPAVPEPPAATRAGSAR